MADILNLEKELTQGISENDLDVFFSVVEKMLDNISLKKVEPPALHIRANAIIIYDKGKQTDNPANAEVPLKLPTNIRSTML